MWIAHEWGMDKLYRIAKRAAISIVNTSNCWNLMRLLASLDDKRMTRHVVEFIRGSDLSPKAIDEIYFGHTCVWILTAIACVEWTTYD